MQRIARRGFFALSAKYSATYRSEAKNVSVARQAVANFARSCGFSGAEVSEIEMAAGEAIKNAAQHGGDRQGGSFFVRCTCLDDALQVEVRDTGRGFQQTAQEQQERSSAPSSGFGLGIMRAFMNSITYSKNGTVVTMVRHRPPVQKDGNGRSH